MVAAAPATAHAQRFETALVVAMDVSGSVDAKRHRLQIEGLAQALVDPQVDRAIVDAGGILFMLVTWSDHARIAIDWCRIGSVADAAAAADVVRNLPPTSGEFTCVGRMFRTLSEAILPDVPATVTRTVIDVSGDGSDNCMDPETLREERDAVLAFRTTVNGLPVVEHGVNDVVNSGAFRAPGYGLRAFSQDPGHDQTTLDRWYAAHVVGGPGAFTLIAKGYGDFTRALRRKFVLEISDGGFPGVAPPDASSSAKRAGAFQHLGGRAGLCRKLLLPLREKVARSAGWGVGRSRSPACRRRGERTGFPTPHPPFGHLLPQGEKGAPALRRRGAARS